jgi:Family of unknown function (DUF5706)
MSNKQQREAWDAALSATLARTIDFLKFAETKNAALLTFASAWFLALANLLTSDRLPYPGPRIAIAASLFFFVLAALVALWSFLPKLKLDRFHRDPERKKNLLYFGDIAEFEATTYATRFEERYTDDPTQVVSENYLHDLAVQVSANSALTLRKFNIFNIGAALVMLALIILTATAAVLTYYHLWTR